MTDIKVDTTDGPTLKMTDVKVDTTDGPDIKVDGSGRIVVKEVLWKNASQEWVEHRLSKRLCYLLRYGALKEGLHVDSAGFVDLRELLTVPLLKGHSDEEVMDELLTSLSGRGMKRFEVKRDHEKTFVRAVYARRMEKNPCHEDSKVSTLFESCIQVIMANLDDYDLEEFPDEFIINTMIHRLKREKKLNTKALQTLLVSTLEHLDLEGLYLTNNILRTMWTKCPRLKSLCLRDCGYIVTDNMLVQIVKKLPELSSLNLGNCQYITDIGLRSIQKHCKNLVNLNISGIRTVTEAGVINLIMNSPDLQQVDMYNMHMSPENRQTLAEITEVRNLKVVLRGFDNGDVSP